MEKVFIGDIEADGLLDTATRVWCGVFKNVDTNEKYKFRPHQIEEMLTFMDTIDVLIMHNGIGYDWRLLKKLHGYVYRGRKVDTLIMSRLQDPNRRSPPHCPNKIAPHSVEAWGYRVGRGKPEHNDWSQFSEEMLHRCDEDVEIQHLILKELIKEANGKNWKDALQMTYKLFDVLNMSEEYGWLVDKEHMDFSIYMLTRWISMIDRVVIPYLPIILEIEETKKNGEYNYVRKPFKKDGSYSESALRWCEEVSIDSRSGIIGGPFSRISFRPVNLESNKETKEFLLSYGWSPVDWNYNSEGERTSPKLSHDDPFEGIDNKLGKLVAKRVQCKHRRATLVGWSQVIRDDGRIPSIVVGLTTTARARHQNIVNVPGGKSFFGKWMRKCFITKPGWKLVGTDSDACQIRMLAARMGDDNYTDSVLNGKKEDGSDQHSVNMRAAGLSSRDDAKTFFYGIIFGAGDKKTGKIVKGNADDGKRLKEKFFEGLPALKNLVDKLTDEWRATAKKVYNPKFNRMEYADGYIIGLDGRPIYVPSEHMVLVYALQSDEAIMMSAAYLKFYQWMNKAGYKWGEDYGIVCWYHDEWTTECREEIAEHVAELAKNAITWAGEYFKIACPHLGQSKIGNNWWEIH
jgi:DNA polymerase I